MSSLVLNRPAKQCNFIEYKDSKLVYKRCVGGLRRTRSVERHCFVLNYFQTTFNAPSRPRRYASLFFVAGIGKGDNELLTLEVIHQYVEVLDRYFGNVCELDIIFNFHRAYYILDEIVLGGELQESNKREVLRVCAAQDDMMDADNAAIHRR